MDLREITLPNDVLGSFAVINTENREFLRITHDRRVIIEGDIYEAGKAFWDLVKQMTPPGYKLEVSDKIG